VRAWGRVRGVRTKGGARVGLRAFEMEYRNPGEVDREGRPVNPHIPTFIAEAPWYAAADGLQHQRRTEVTRTAELGDWYSRGRVAGPAASRYRKGACENCGAMTHKKKDCLERPRARGARWTHQDIAPDEILDDLELSFAAKRDRWNGFDPSDYKQVVEMHERAEEARRQVKAAELAKQSKSDSASSDDENEFVTSGAVIQERNRTTVRNLRIREDTANYLKDIGKEDVPYDPKSRSSRDSDLAGDDFVRASSSRTNPLGWLGEAVGSKESGFAAPSQVEIEMKNEARRKSQESAEKRASILEKYGGSEYLKSVPVEQIAQREYMEYSADGTVISSATEKASSIPVSKYVEDGKACG